jgi:hypothetical protein
MAKKAPKLPSTGAVATNLVGGAKPAVTREFLKNCESGYGKYFWLW